MQIIVTNIYRWSHLTLDLNSNKLSQGYMRPIKEQSTPNNTVSSPEINPITAPIENRSRQNEHIINNPSKKNASI